MTSGHETGLPYNNILYLTERSCPIGRLFLFSIPYDTGNNAERNKKERDEEYRLGIPGTTGQSWQMLLFGRQGQALRFQEKSSSLRSGIFPENLALPEAFTVGPL